MATTVSNLSNLSNLQPSDIKSMMCGKRKLRIPKACYPCYKRKVKCDRTSPCTLCVKRGHAHLCTYTHPAKKPSSPPLSVSDGDRATTVTFVDKASTITMDKKPGNVLVDTKEWKNINEKLAEMSHSISTLRSKLEQVSTSASPSAASDSGTETSSNREGEGIHMRNALGGSPVHFGSSSVLAFIMERSRRSSDANFVFREDGILPQLALENQMATYPFLDLWSSDVMTFGSGAVCAALPDDNLCQKLLQCYRDVRMTLYPVLTNFDQFERDVETLLRNRSLVGLSNHAMSSVDPFGFSVAFIGILFAVLASGCQVSDLPKKERSFLGQVYLSCSYQCLRNGNFLSRPTMEAIQAFLIIGDVLSYNMNPGVAYVTFGVAQRMALTLGLHIESAAFPPNESFTRRRLWWSMAWQDSHFALSYDRPVETLAPNPQIPNERTTVPSECGYFVTMCRVIALTLQLLREEILSAEPQLKSNAIPAYKEELNQVLAGAAPYLRNEEYCFTVIHHVERLTLKLRASYLVSEICRRALKPRNCQGKKITTSLCIECIESLISTVEAYVELHQIVPHASRSWIPLHSAISSAFLLAVDEGAQSDPDVWSILEKLENVLIELTSADGQDPSSSGTGSTNTITPPSSSSGEMFGTGLPPRDEIALNRTQPLGRTFMLSDFPMVPDVTMADASTPSGPTEADFLMGTLDTLRKINAGFSVQKAKQRPDSKETAEKGKGSCCAKRCHC